MRTTIRQAMTAIANQAASRSWSEVLPLMMVLIRRQLSKRGPEIPAEDLDLMVKLLKKELEQDPLALL